MEMTQEKIDDKNTLQVMKFTGDDRRIYYLIAHLTMDEEVLAYNLNYPYRTSPFHHWYIATRGQDTVGFIPVRMKQGVATINNYYIVGDDSAVYAQLLQEVLWELTADYLIEAVVQTRQVQAFLDNGFIVTLWWKRFAKMIPASENGRQGLSKNM